MLLAPHALCFQFQNAIPPLILVVCVSSPSPFRPQFFINKEVEASKYSNAELIASYADRVLKPGPEKLSDAQVRLTFHHLR